MATKSELAGTLLGHLIFKVKSFDIIPFHEYTFTDSTEETYVELVKNHLSAAPLYFSHTYDLTNAFQRHNNQVGWKKADERFFWNQYILHDLIEMAENHISVQDFICPMIYGYVNIIPTTINNQLVTFGLITRRSKHRAGTRYFRRGIDSDGNVANFNETEQILCVPTPSTDNEHDVSVFSYVQTRGSIPVQWAEINNLRYRPKLNVLSHAVDSAREHFSQQKQIYGKNYLVNLVNQSGYELPVKTAYEMLVNELNDPELSYIYFDFHHECSKMRWDRVQLLIENLEAMGLDEQKWFQAKFGNEKKAVLEVQTSVVRTNCMDCLDRTNVVQSQLAKWVLQKQLIVAGVLPNSNHIIWDIDPAFTAVFRGMWADNANVVSTSYSGTGALKTDFTRLGKRTKLGALSDLRNSISRYFKNNLLDGPRQDGFDLFLGSAKAYDTLVDPFTDYRPIIYQCMPYFFSGSVIMLLAAFLFPKESLTWSLNRLFLVLWTGAVAFSLKFVLDNGIQYVNWPKLIDLDYVQKVPIKNSKGTKTFGYLIKEIGQYDPKSLEEGKLA